MPEQLIPWEDMRAPALAIVARGDQIEPVAPTEYKVHSQSHPEKTYTVQSFRDRWTCSCDFFTQTGIVCIHILAVRYRSGFLGSKEEPEKVVCVKCRSGDVVANGKRRNKSGVVTRYLCKTCGLRFTGKDGFQRRRADPEKIALALDLYFRGMSLRQIVEHFSQVHALKVSHTTVYRWITHYSALAAQWLDSQDAIVGEKWNIDETVVNVNGQNHYLWNVMDSETRMLIATHISRTRSLDETRAPLKKAKNATQTVPTEIRSDGMGAYPKAIRKEFGRHGHSPHKLVPNIRAEESNNLVERLHGTEKSRTKVMRAFDQETGAAAIMDGWRVHYDVVRMHQALGKTPAEAADIAPLVGFKWHELLKLAITRNVTADKQQTASTR
ncbi:MAG TPA: IS6 family transposase [Thermoplasmata archaeon]